VEETGAGGWCGGRPAQAAGVDNQRQVAFMQRRRAAAGGIHAAPVGGGVQAVLACG
jgi:hypothetical protein